MALAVDEARQDSGTRGNGTQIHLPTELVLAIFSFLPHDSASQSTFHACILVCRQWYEAGVAHLYHTPHLTPGNLSSFVATVMPMSSKSCVRGDQLAGFVRRLDMGRLVHDRKKSLTAKLLGRMKGGLEEFVAPVATFAWADSFLISDFPKTLTNDHRSVNCFAALSKCVCLRLLDLTLISESISLSELAHAIRSLPRLRVLYFPRSSHYHRGFSVDSLPWPPCLRALTLAGGISGNFLLLTANSIPPTLDTLTVEYCPFAKGIAIRNLLAQLAPQLRNLKISYHIPTLRFNELDQLLLICPQLHTLTIAVDYISSRFFDEENAPKPSHPLYLLTLESSGNLGVDQKIGPNDIYIAVCEGGLANLRQVQVSEQLGWTSDEMKDDVRDLVDLLEIMEADDAKEDGGEYVESQRKFEESEELAIRKGVKSRPRTFPVKAGVWTFAS